MSDPFDADYFLRGKETGKSLYSDYRWLPDLTIPMAQAIVEHCGVHQGSRVLDFGCARGYLVRALRGLGYDAFGYDISRWALENADEEVKKYLYHKTENRPPWEHQKFDWIIAKDVLEHVEYVEIIVGQLMMGATGGIFVVVPLSKFDGGKYVVDDYEKDITHIQRYKLSTWAKMFIRPGWKVEVSYRVPGVKDNYQWAATGNGFITARRLDS